MRLACDNIIATEATQVRVKLNKELIDQYHEDLDAGAIFPPIAVFRENDSEAYWLGDGFHRLISHIHAGIEEIAVEVYEGGKHEALVFALGANTTNGLRRSNADKINAVKMALNDPEIAEHTQQEIADICRVTRETVNRISRREFLEDDDEVESQEPEENKPENKRPTKEPPTQAEVERDELRQAMGLVKALPYPGADAIKLELDPDDVANLEYVSTWCAHAVLAYRDGDRQEQK